MTDKEKEAIKYFKELRYGEINDNYKDIILNLIENQQKEIEQKIIQILNILLK